MNLFIQLLEDYVEDVKDNLINVIPRKFVIAILIGAIPTALYFYFGDIDIQQNSAMLIAIPIAFLTFNGVVWALSWSAMTKIYEILSMPIIREHLHAEGGYGKNFFFYIQHAQFVQFWTIVVSLLFLINFIALAIVESVYLLHLYFIFLGITVFISYYSIVVTHDLVKTIHTLLRGEADASYDSEDVDDNGSVTNINSRRK